ncbi:MAG TPA: 30S ribosomal protein S2, partial [Candidatus Omnitrophota bacterium]|nr:30S ribosomal protein S2 [Candidatus Omnitrophota bacterium]
NKMHIPIVGIIDTNCDPEIIDYPIPGNDDAIRSIRYICTMLCDVINKGRHEHDGVKKITPVK